jgi:AcrR family transcriptional regulator
MVVIEYRLFHYRLARGRTKRSKESGMASSETVYAQAVRIMTTLVSHPDAPTTAEVARRLGTDESQLTEVFRDDAHLLEAALENALVLLHDQCVTSVVRIDPDDPLAQFVALSDAYIEWANRHPAEFMILGSLPAKRAVASGNLLRYEQSIHALMLRMLKQAQGKGLIEPDADIKLLVTTARSFAYGVAQKMISGNIARWMETDASLDAARRALHLFTRKIMTPTPA